MSKTLGNVVDPRDIVKEYGTDALRYFLLKEVSSFEDSPFTLERFKDAYNSGLANGLGNLVSRVLTLSERYLQALPVSRTELPKEFYEYFEKFDLQKAMEYIWNLAQYLDRKIQVEEPFKVIKTDENKGREMIKKLVFGISIISELLIPFLPETSEKIKELIKANKKPEIPLFPRKD